MTAARGAFSPLYASPQQLAGADPDSRDDVFAAGVIWYQILTGDLLEWPTRRDRNGRSPWKTAVCQLLWSPCSEILLSRERPAHRPNDAAALADSIALRFMRFQRFPKVAGPQTGLRRVSGTRTSPTIRPVNSHFLPFRSLRSFRIRNRLIGARK